MTNTSATGGYLVPETSPLGRTAIEERLRALVAGVTGLDGKLVRPRWQRTPAPVPHLDTDWCSLGIQSTAPQGFPATTHNPEGEGSDEVSIIRRLRVLCSFYGPGAHDLAARLNSGLTVGQNRAEILTAGISLTSLGEPIAVPELVNSDWLERVDVELFFDVEERRSYPVRNLEGGRLSILTDTGLAREVTIKED